MGGGDFFSFVSYGNEILLLLGCVGCVAGSREGVLTGWFLGASIPYAFKFGRWCFFLFCFNFPCI